MTIFHTKSGHRQRLRDKFLTSGFAGFHDYEIIELLLTLATPRSDCKSQAKELIKKFKTVRAILEADDHFLKEVKGVGSKNLFGLKLGKEVAEYLLKEKTKAKIDLSSSKTVFDYLYVSMRDSHVEKFKVLYLDNQNFLIHMEDLFTGTVDASSIFPREVIKKALKYNATGMIFVHNHPSGNPKPSKNDQVVTKELIEAANIMRIRVLDHLIIGDNKYFSFADKGML